MKDAAGCLVAQRNARVAHQLDRAARSRVTVALVCLAVEHARTGTPARCLAISSVVYLVSSMNQKPTSIPIVSLRIRSMSGARQFSKAGSHIRSNAAAREGAMNGHTKTTSRDTERNAHLDVDELMWIWTSGAGRWCEGSARLRRPLTASGSRLRSPVHHCKSPQSPTTCRTLSLTEENSRVQAWIQDAFKACFRRPRGRVMRNVLPPASEPSRVSRPALASTAPFAIDRPSPVPGAAPVAVRER